jgi:hypothetical protein
MSTNAWMNDEDYIVWLWETSHTSLQQAPAGTRPFAEAAVHALLATLRDTQDLPGLRRRYHAASPQALALIQSLLPCGPGSPAAEPLTDADYEWLLVLEDAAYYLRYCELTGRRPEVPAGARSTS